MFLVASSHTSVCKNPFNGIERYATLIIQELEHYGVRIHLMELKDSTAEQRFAESALNPFNGIERRKHYGDAEILKMQLNPFNGIESPRGASSMLCSVCGRNPFNGIESVSYRLIPSTFT